jgi:hypothetical protein
MGILLLNIEVQSLELTPCSYEIVLAGKLVEMVSMVFWITG